MLPSLLLGRKVISLFVYRLHQSNLKLNSTSLEDMRDHIWSDRLLLRFRMKKELKTYRSFLREIVSVDSGRQVGEDDVIDVNDAIPILHKFCTNDLPAKKLREVFQMPRSELTEVLKSRYKICSAYAVCEYASIDFNDVSLLAHLLLASVLHGGR